MARFVDLWDAHPDKDDAYVVRARRAVQAYRTNRGSSEFKLTDPLSQCLDLNTVRSRVKERIVDPIVGECHGVPPLMASFLLATERQHGRRSGIPAAPDDILFE